MLSYIRKAFIFATLTTILSACGGSGGGGSTPATPPAKPSEDQVFEQDYNITISSSQCMNPFFMVSDLQEELGHQIRSGDAPCVKKILELGAKATEDIVEFGSHKKIRPLQFALNDGALFFAKNSLGSFAVIKVLAEAGADLNEKNSEGMTVLQQAIQNDSILSKHPTVAGYILQSGRIQIDSKDLRGRTALHIALEKKQSDLAKLLVKFGSSVDQKNGQGLTPLLIALQNGLEAFASSIVNTVKSVEDIDGEQNLALHLAISQKFESLALALLERTSLVNAKNKVQETPFYLAVETNSLALVQALLHKKADADLATFSGAPIHVAIQNQVPDIILAVIKATKNLDVKNSLTQTPLVLATMLGTAEQVSWLLERASVDLADGKGMTALHLASQLDALDKIQLLIAAHANVNALTLEKRSPLFLVKSLSAARLLIEAQARLNQIDSTGATVLSKFVIDNQTDLALFVANQGADINWKDSQKKNLLAYSVDSNNLSLASYFLQNKLNPNAADVNGRTALFSAYSNELIDLLVSNGADINAKDKSGNTVILEKVLSYNQHPMPNGLALIQKILEFGAKTDVVATDGNTLVSLAVLAKPMYSGNPLKDMNLPYDNSLLLSLLTKFKAPTAGFNKSGNSAIHIADTAKEIQILADAQANINLKNRKGETALSKNEKELSEINLAIEKGEQSIQVVAQKLKEAEDKGQNDLVAMYRRQLNGIIEEVAVKKNQKEIVTELLATLRALGAH